LRAFAAFALVALVVSAGLSIISEQDYPRGIALVFVKLPAATRDIGVIARSVNPLTHQPEQPVPTESIQSLASSHLEDRYQLNTVETEKPVDWLRVLFPELVRIAELESHLAAMAEILSMLDNNDPAVRPAAVESLGDMTREAIVPEFPRALGDTEDRLRIAALEALTARGDAELVGVIETLLYDPERAARLAAIEALAHLGLEAAVHSLAGLLSDPDTLARRHAVHALGEIGGEHAMMYLLQLRYDSNEKIRKNAKPSWQSWNTKP
jgi:hypothetical protein